MRVRFAPSPSGELHVGGARTALFNWLYAQQQGGQYLLRIEDTDKDRNRPELVEPIKESLQWLGLNWDEDIYFQSEHIVHHQECVQRLLAQGKAYKCFCTTEELAAKREAAQKAKENYRYDGKCRSLTPQQIEAFESDSMPSVVRLKVDETGHELIQDIVLGELNFSYEEVDDFIIQRSNGLPIYNFAVAVDDAQMGITHVIRAKEHQKNTLRQILVYRALGHSEPHFAHVPMVLAQDRSKLSKRHGATAVFEYRDRGILPEALVNYLVRLGWSHGDDEIFSIQELIEKFSLEAIHSSDAVFDEEKLLWLNHHYIMHGDEERLGVLTRDFAVERNVLSESEANDIDAERWTEYVGLMKERCHTLVELAETAKIYLSESLVHYDEKVASKFLTQDKAPILKILVDALIELNDDEFTTEHLDSVVRSALEDNNSSLKEAAQPSRIALTGVPQGPGLFEAMAFLGKEQVIQRLLQAIDKIDSVQPTSPQ